MNSYSSIVVRFEYSLIEIFSNSEHRENASFTISIEEAIG